MTLLTGLTGKVALVTGAGSRGTGTGVGKAIALTLAKHGARLGLVNLDRPALDVTLNEVSATGADAVAVEADVSSSDGCANAVAAVVRQFGRLDILVNVVGTEGALGNATEVDPDAWDSGLRVNTTSVMLMSKHAIPHIAEAGGGSIVNIASVSGMFAGLPSLLYPASKAAVIMMTKSMALHHGWQGIRVNSVSPGMIYTPMVEDATPQMRDARKDASMLGTEGTGWDIADAVLFLTSDQARWITAVNLPVDAGLTAKLTIPNPAY